MRSTANTASDTDLAARYKALAAAAEFFEDVARTNYALMRGYKGNHNEFCGSKPIGYDLRLTVPSNYRDCLHRMHALFKSALCLIPQYCAAAA
ncbi:hypothetical protein [Comamonas antarctica]|uniref:Uncharacterized protein n=1 Tax=Comamonas antarctica TaxID=2743470 RepID=A0A6N1XCA6_9BURK|nr:hypothetical protein [Comamonas antarctica]QKV55812.1 hypothetical protein HUK68_23115 [Comamonas antarctica]